MSQAVASTPSSRDEPSRSQAHGERLTRLLVIGHHIVVKEYQELWTSAAKQYPNLSIEILCPEVYEQMGAVRSESLDQDLVPVHRLKTFFGRSGRQHLHFYRGLGKTLDVIRPDYVYCAEESNSLVAAQVARACKKRGVPVLFWTALNQLRIYRRMYGRLNIRRYLFHHCQRYTFAHCVAANATSEAAREVLRQQGYQGHVVCRPTLGIGNDFLRIGEERVARQTGPSSPMEVGFVGRLTNVKAVDVLIRALARMRHRDRIYLTIRGKGEREAEWKAVAKAEGVADELEWVPTIPYHCMPQVMKGLDVLVLPSMSRDGEVEQFGRVIIEAMAAGAVAVGSRDGGIPVAMAGSGILFPPGDSDELARVLDRLCTDTPYWKSQQKAGCEAVKATYSYDVISRKLIEGIREEVGWFRT